MTVGLVDLLHGTAAACRDADPTGWTSAERDDVLRGLSTISYEVVGLSARIRAAKVNDTKPPHPVKPLNPKPADKPADPPKDDPPPPPTKDRSATTGSGRTPTDGGEQ